MKHSVAEYVRGQAHTNGVDWSWPRAVDSYGLEIQAAGAYLLS